MCKYCETPDCNSATPAYDVNTGSDALLYADPVTGGWIFKVQDEDEQAWTRICVAFCPWCGRLLD